MLTWELQPRLSIYDSEEPQHTKFVVVPEAPNELLPFVKGARLLAVQTIDFAQGHVNRAVSKYNRAKQVYESKLPLMC